MLLGRRPRLLGLKRANLFLFQHPITLIVLFLLRLFPLFFLQSLFPLDLPLERPVDNSVISNDESNTKDSSHHVEGFRWVVDG